MPDPFVISLALAFAAALLIRLAVRARKSAKSIVRWGGAGAAVVLALAAFGTVVVAGMGQHKLQWRSSPDAELTFADSPQQYERGRAIAASLCSACHTDKLTGGVEIGKTSLGMIGSFVSANLTPIGRVRQWSDAEIFQAIRHSVDPQGHRLTIMSLTNNGNLSDDDTRAVVTYVRRLPASGAATSDTPDRFSYLGLLMLGAGLFPSGSSGPTGIVTAPPKSPTYAYGEYILSYWDCRQCHGERLTGGVRGQIAPIGPDLTIVKGWSPEEFIATFRTGRDPNGHLMVGEMPWRTIGKMDDEELRAIYAYLKQMPKVTTARAGQ